MQSTRPETSASPTHTPELESTQRCLERGTTKTLCISSTAAVDLERQAPTTATDEAVDQTQGYVRQSHCAEMSRQPGNTLSWTSNGTNYRFAKDSPRSRSRIRIVDTETKSLTSHTFSFVLRSCEYHRSDGQCAIVSSDVHR